MSSAGGGMPATEYSFRVPHTYAKKNFRILLGTSQVSVSGPLDLCRQKYIAQVLRQSQSFFRHLQSLPYRAVDIFMLRWCAAKNCN